MKKIVSFFVWGLVFGLLLLALDQFFLRVPAEVGPHREAQTFYLDFRTRLLALWRGGTRVPPPAPVAKEAGPKPAAAATPGGAPVIEAPAARYIYVDQGGELHFADSLQEVPDAYRLEARPLSR